VAKWASGGNLELGRLGRTTTGLIDDRKDTIGGASHLVQTYDMRGRVTRFMVESRGGLFMVNRADQTYTWSQNSDLRSMTTSLAAGTTRTFNFGYDARHQLTTATGPFSYNATFGYRPGGKLDAVAVSATGVPSITKRNVVYDYEADDPDAVSALLDATSGQPWASYQYDESGNAIVRNLAGTVGTDHTHVYDGADQQRKVTAADGSREIYFYDEDGRRRFILTFGAANGPLQRVRWTLGDTEIHFTGSGVISKAYAYVNLDGPIARIDGTNAELTFHNHLGHLIATTNAATGTQLGGYSYTPFGELIEQVGSTPAAFDRTFNGKQKDDVAKLHYYGARYYDPVLLSWTQSDPLYRFAPETMGESPRRAMLYTFSLNNPLRFVDADGLDSASKTCSADEDVDVCAIEIALEGADLSDAAVARRKEAAAEYHPNIELSPPKVKTRLTDGSTRVSIAPVVWKTSWGKFTPFGFTSSAGPKGLRQSFNAGDLEFKVDSRFVDKIGLKLNDYSLTEGKFAPAQLYATRGFEIPGAELKLTATFGPKFDLKSGKADWKPRVDAKVEGNGLAAHLWDHLVNPLNPTRDLIEVYQFFDYTANWLSEDRSYYLTP
jgi:RHS repeat-associated protein